MERQRDETGLIEFEVDISDEHLRSMRRAIGSTSMCSVEVTDIEGNRLIHRYTCNADDNIRFGEESEYESIVPPEPEHDYLTSPIDFKGVDEEAQMKYIESFMKQIEAISQKLSIKPVKGDLVNTLQAEWVSTDDPKYLDVPYDEAKKAIIEDSKDRSDYGYFLIERTGYVKRTENRHGRLCVNDGSRWVRIWKVLDKNTLLEKTIDPTEVKTLVSGLRALCTANNYTEGDEILSLMEAEYVPKD
jgi:hypothetical protein